MTTPTLLSRETLNGQVFEVQRALFVTPRGSCGVRLIYRIDRVKVKRQVWEARRAEAASFRAAA